MMNPIILLVTIAFWLPAPSFSEELRAGQVLFTFGRGVQSVETEAIRAIVSFGGSENEPNYRIDLTDRNTGRRGSATFLQEPTEPRLSDYNVAFYCNEPVLLLTLRYAPPVGADIRQYWFETHAFRATTLDYLDTAPANFADIAPTGADVDLGFPYVLPQDFHVDCVAGNGKFDFHFVPNVERPK